MSTEGWSAAWTELSPALGRTLLIAMPAAVISSGLLRTFGSLILPLSLPGFVVTMIWQFTSVWNDYLFAVFLSSKDNGPVILGLANLAGSQIIPYPEVFAGALIVTAPTLLVYIVLGRWFVGGLMAGAIKT